jgi:predicted alpha/beta superfamily hydrolase
LKLVPPKPDSLLPSLAPTARTQKSGDSRRAAADGPGVLPALAADGSALVFEDRFRGFTLHSQFLPDDREVLVYLPEAYEREPEQRFPVFYLHDGQNLFDGRTSYVAGQTWRAHTTADRLTAAGAITPLILVGVANTGVRRMDEYTPTRDVKLGGGEGASYGRLLVDELKPVIDSAYRTRIGPEHTGLGGSSLGGLITLALGLQMPEIYGRLAVMSPSVWWDQRSILESVLQAQPEPRPRIWLDMGTAEGAQPLRDTDLLHRRLQARGWQDGVDLKYMREAAATHAEQAWARRFEPMLRFLFPAES